MLEKRACIYGTPGVHNNFPSFGGFGTTGDVNTRKRELAAFLAQTSHETTGIISLINILSLKY